MSNIEKMDEFFNRRADGYEDHMLGCKDDYDYYSMVTKKIVPTDKSIEVLDLGCGTGLELKEILNKCPNVNITGIDLSEKMLEILKNKYKSHLSKINVIKGSYLDMKFPDNKYDYVISSMTMHHFTKEIKKKLYTNIKNYLKKETGIYIEGDYMVNSEYEQQCLKEYMAKISTLKQDDSNIYHIDIPCSIDTQSKLLIEAGLKNIEIVYQKGIAAVLAASL